MESYSCLEVVADVAVGEHYAFGCSGGAGSVDEAGQAVRRRGANLSETVILAKGAQDLKGIDVDHEMDLCRYFRIQFCELPLGGEENLALGVLKHMLGFVSGEIRKDRHCDPSECRCAEERYTPIRSACRVDCHFVVLSDSVEREGL